MRYGWRKYLLYTILLTMIGGAAQLSGPVSASGSQAATFDRLEVNTDPSIQGLGGEITVNVVAYFYGGCCYSLFANDIIPTLEVPGGLNISSGPTPERRGSLTAVAGGEPTTVSFTYVLSCDVLGKYSLKTKVKTSDCGSREAEFELHVIKGATIETRINPLAPSAEPGTMKSFAGREITVDVKAAYKVGNVKVTSGQIYYVDHTGDLGSDLRTENGSLFKDGEMIGNGKIVECSVDEGEEGSFHAVLPGTSMDFRYIWVQVTDEYGNTTTSSVQGIAMEDEERVSFYNTISVVFLVITMTGLLLILYGSQRVLKRRMDGVESEDRFSVLGPVGRKRMLTDTESGKISVIPEKNWKFIVVGIVAILMIGTFALLLLTGDAGDLFDHFLEGK
jgi:hypothetical protein